MKAFSLNPNLFWLLIQRPGEFLEVAAKWAELKLDRYVTRPTAYQPVEWNQCVRALGDQVPGWPSLIGSDEGLASIECTVAKRWQPLASSAPWHSGFSADLALARALYQVCRALKPELVVETGVAYGMSSAFILKALQENGRGRLESIDLPPLGRKRDSYVGVLVPDDMKARWTLHRRSSRRALPEILQGRAVDVFVHDSSHTYLNMRREFNLVWPHLSRGGLIVSDDIECSPAFEELRCKNPRFWQPIREEGKRSLFGIAVK